MRDKNGNSKKHSNCIIYNTLRSFNYISNNSGAITGSTTNNFYEKNKGRTRDGALKKATVVLGVFFAIGSIGLSFLYLM